MRSSLCHNRAMQTPHTPRRRRSIGTKLDPSKWLAILLSLTAITISSLSWWESHRSRLVTEEINRPILTIDGVTIRDSSWRRAPSATKINNDNFVRFDVRIKNSGKVTAIWTKDKAYTESFDNDCAIVSRQSYMTDTGSTDLIPGFDIYVEQGVSLSPNCGESKGFALTFSITVDYTDASGRPYRQFLSEAVRVSPDDERSKRPSPLSSPRQ